MAIPRKLTANFVATEVDDEVLIVDLDGGLLFSLQGTARSVWQAIDGDASSDQIATRMAQVHNGEPREIADDVAELLHDLAAAKLIALG